LSVSNKTTETAIFEYSEKEVTSIANALGVCLLAQRTYGKQAADIDRLTKIFIRVLNEFPPEAILAAIKKWLITSPEFPTPADIKNILCPSPKLDKAVYVSIKKKVADGSVFVADAEYSYLKFYENSILGAAQVVR
jgi:hypothetical protein